MIALKKKIVAKSKNAERDEKKNCPAKGEFK